MIISEVARFGPICDGGKYITIKFFQIFIAYFEQEFFTFLGISYDVNSEFRSYLFSYAIILFLTIVSNTALQAHLQCVLFWVDCLVNDRAVNLVYGRFPFMVHRKYSWIMLALYMLLKY